MDINIPNVYFEPRPEFDINNAVYPNNPNDFYSAYEEVLEQILENSKLIVEEYEQGLK